MNAASRLRTPTTAPLLQLEGVTKVFRAGSFRTQTSIRAVDDVSLTVEERTIHALVGESGSGKSTIAALVTRLERPTGGRVLLRGEDVSRLRGRSAVRAYRQRVQMVFQDPFSSLNPVCTVGYPVARAVAIHQGLRGEERMRRTHELLTEVGLTPAADVAHSFPHELSGGQRQRVAIAAALAADPELIVADEPTSMLDVSIRMGILNLMRRLRDERGIGILYITHDLASSRYLADETTVMYAGQVVESAPTPELIASPVHPYTKLLIAAAPNPRARRRVGAPATDLATAGIPEAGCRFAPRCPLAIESCRRSVPVLTRLGARLVRCPVVTSHLREAAS